MPSPLKVIFVENHFDTACYTINKLFPQLVDHQFKYFFYERGEAVTYETTCEEIEAGIKNISDRLPELHPRRDGEEIFYSTLLKNNFEATLAVLKKVRENGLVYKGVDNAVAEEDLGYFGGETKFSEDDLARIHLERSQAMATAYMHADEHTVGVMGYGHAEQAMQTIVHNNQEDEFVFIFLYNQQSELSEEDEAFLACANNLPMPVLCLDAKLGEDDDRNIEIISDLFHEKRQPGMGGPR